MRKSQIKTPRPLLKITVDELYKVRRGVITPKAEIEVAKQYALGRFQRSAQTVGGTAAGYAGRYFFDGVVEDYYQGPERIKAIEKDKIIDVTEAMFADNIWGFGILGNCGEVFTHQLANNRFLRYGKLSQLKCQWIGSMDDLRRQADELSRDFDKAYKRLKISDLNDELLKKREVF